MIHYINYDKQNKANPYAFIAKRISDNKRIKGPVIEIKGDIYILQRMKDKPQAKTASIRPDRPLYEMVQVRPRTLRKATQKENIRYLLEQLRPGDAIHVTNKDTGETTILNHGDKLPINLYPHKKKHLIRLVQMDVYHPEQKQEIVYETNYDAKRMLKAYTSSCKKYHKARIESDKPITHVELLTQFGAFTKKWLKKTSHKVTIYEETGQLVVPENISAEIIMRLIAYSMPKDFEYKPVQKVEVPENLIVPTEHESYRLRKDTTPPKTDVWENFVEIADVVNKYTKPSKE